MATCYESAWSAFSQENYEDAIKYAEKGKDEFVAWGYFYLIGMCHFYIFQDLEHRRIDLAQQLNIKMSDYTDINFLRYQNIVEGTNFNVGTNSDPRWDEIKSIAKKTSRHQNLAYDNLKKSLSKIKEDSTADTSLTGKIFNFLVYTTNDIYERRRFLIGGLSCNELFNPQKYYKELTQEIIRGKLSFDDGYIELEKIANEKDYWKKNGNPSEEDKQEVIELNKSQLFSSIAYHERQFIYIAKDLNDLAGCYDDNIQWVFTIDMLPIEIQFPIGHPQPNSLYYAHPTKKAVYLPLEQAEEELFNDKIREFRRLVQCLGATEIRFRSVKGRSLLESYSKSLNIDFGGKYKGFGGNVEYGNKRSRNRDENMNGQRELVQQFNPTRPPYIPEDITWLDVDPEWQSLVKQRLEGNMLHYSIRISSKKTMSATDSKMDEVKIAFKSFIANAHVNFSQQMEHSFRREEGTEWEISVSFKPIPELKG